MKEKVPNRHCLVCRYYRPDTSHCTKGWEHTWCDMEDFAPSVITAAQLILDEAEFIEIADGETLDKIMEMVYKKWGDK